MTDLRRLDLAVVLAVLLVGCGEDFILQAMKVLQGSGNVKQFYIDEPTRVWVKTQAWSDSRKCHLGEWREDSTFWAKLDCADGTKVRIDFRAAEGDVLDRKSLKLMLGSVIEQRPNGRRVLTWDMGKPQNKEVEY